MSKPIKACLIVDDLPISGTYWQRIQQTAMGLPPRSTGPWGTDWEKLAPAPFMRVNDLERFADIVEKHGIKGKCTLLPCPAGLGKLDNAVRGFSSDELDQLLNIMRERIAPSFDITPEVLTHTMAYDVEQDALLPHTESAWISFLARENRMEELTAYIGAGYKILHNCGFAPHGLTVGGMADLSEIAQGEMVLEGFHRSVLAEALLLVEREYDSSVAASFIYTGSEALDETFSRNYIPEPFWQSDDQASVYELFSSEDPLLPLLHGGDPMKIADGMVSPDLKQGSLIEDAEAGKNLVITVHAQTLNALNTGAGLTALDTAVTRLKEHYGNRLEWYTTDELCIAADGK